VNAVTITIAAGRANLQPKAPFTCVPPTGDERCLRVPSPQMAGRHGHSPDDYLETIYFLSLPVGEYRPATGRAAIAARIADLLGVSRVAASEMLKRLESDQLVERGDRKQAILTPKGMERARKMVRRHRIIERFLTDFMLLTPTECHEVADRTSDAFDDTLLETLYERLGRPARCPHGWPIDTELEREESLSLFPLSELEPDERAVIVRLAEHDQALLAWFYDHGFVPDVHVKLLSASKAAGQLTVEAKGTGHTLGWKAAASLYVKLA
jgi:DtxR family transcriptional regulator, Mn-dependent transcriptional regulator